MSYDACIQTLMYKCREHIRFAEMQPDVFKCLCCILAYGHEIHAAMSKKKSPKST